MRAALVTCLVLSAVGSQLCSSSNQESVQRSRDMSDSSSVGTLVADPPQCPAWQYWKTNHSGCVCLHSLLETVSCQNYPYSLKIFACFCMTYSNKTEKLVVGSCQLTCKTGKGFYTNITANTSSEINSMICDRYHREGQLCGRCKPGYSPPVYSYSLTCVECTASHWGKYLAVSLLPVTFFYIVVVILRLNATYPMMNALILYLQLTLSPPHQRLIVNSPSYYNNTHEKQIQRLLLSLYGVWNLDFLCAVYTPFCLQPNTNTIHVLAIDYIIAVYPLLLIALSYLLVVLYDQNRCMVFTIYKPFVSLCIKLRKQWDIRNSLVDAFATFLLLSYVKILSVSVDLLMPVMLYDQNQTRLPRLYLFNQADMPYFGHHHLPYACLALFFLFTFTLLPMLLLFLYPLSCFQTCLNRTGCGCQTLHIFMDAFQGHFKDGTRDTRNLRFFSGLYLLLRVLVYASTMLTYQVASYAYTTVLISVMAICVALAQPYKKYLHNMIDAGFLLIFQLLSVSLNPLGFGRFSRLEYGLMPLTSILIALPFVYICVLVAKKLCFSAFQCLKRQKKGLLTSLPQNKHYNSL